MKVTIEEALRRGIAAHREGKIQDAERLYRAILGTQPTHPDANHNLGVLAVGAGKVDVSLPHFKMAVESNPKIEQYWLSYVSALIKLGQNEDARQVLQQGRDTGLKGDKLDQLEAQLINGASEDAVSPSQEQLDGLIALYKKGELQEVLVKGNALSSQFPEDPVIHNILGVVNSGLGKLEAAIASYTKAIRLKPDYAEAYYNLGNAQKETNRVDDAVMSYTKAIEFRPGYVYALSNLGNIFNQLGRYDDAIINYNKAIELQPDYAEAHYNLGNALKELGQHEEAIVSYNKAIEHNPRYIEAYNNIGVILHKLGRYEEAIKTYSSVIKINSNYAGAYNNWGLALKELKQLDLAIEKYEKAIAIKDDYREAISSLGEVLLEKGQHKEGIEKLRTGDGAIAFDAVNSFIIK